MKTLPHSVCLLAWLLLAMETEGFTVLNEEWWHFDYKDWTRYQILDVPSEAIQP